MTVLLQAEVTSGVVNRQNHTATFDITVNGKKIMKLQVKIHKEHHLIVCDEEGNEIERLPYLIGAVTPGPAADQVLEQIPNLAGSHVKLFYRATVGEEKITGEIEFDTDYDSLRRLVNL